MKMYQLYRRSIGSDWRKWGKPGNLESTLTDKRMIECINFSGAGDETMIINLDTNGVVRINYRGVVICEGIGDIPLYTQKEQGTNNEQSRNETTTTT